MSVGDPIVLQFEDSGEWFVLPEWAEYFISIGKQLASVSPAEGRVVTAVVVPTRAYGAAFVGAGMVITEASSRDCDSQTAHFEKLFDLPAGTPVIYRPGKGNALKGIVQQPAEHGGKLWIRVQVQSSDAGGLTRFIDEAHALQVQPTGAVAVKLPKTQKGNAKRLINQFVDHLLGDSDPVQLGVRSKTVCALVGRRSSLEHELKKTPLSITVNGEKHSEGQLQDLLRVNKFVTQQQSYRSALVTTSSASPSADLIKSVEIGVIFDGATGFLKWGTLWPHRHLVVILDRTEAYFEDAISAINARFAKAGLIEGCLIPGGKVPPGGEILSFREVKA